MLIHEMVHFYLGKRGLGWSTEPMEKYALDDAVKFDFRLSLRNPQNYQAFVASKCVRWLPLCVFFFTVIIVGIGEYYHH